MTFDPALFCKDDFWNANVTWYTNTPRLTKCLGNVGLSIAPSFVFLILVLFELKFISNSKNKKISYNKYNVCRQLLCSFAIVTNLITIYYYAFSMLNSDSSRYVSSDLLSVISKLLLFISFAIVYHFSRLNGVITSGLMFTITFLSSVCFGVLLLDSLLYNETMYSDFEQDNFYRTFIAAIVLFAMSWWTDDAVEAGLKPSYEEEALLNNIESDENEYEDQVKAKVSPRVYSSFIRKITFWWFSDFFALSKRKKTIDFTDIWDLEDDMKIELVCKKFDKELDREMDYVRNRNENLDKKVKFNSWNTLKVFLRTCGVELFVASSLKLLADLIAMSSPLLIEMMINFISDKNEYKFHGIFIILGFFSAAILQNFFTVAYNVRSFRAALNLRSCLTRRVFSKALKLSSQAKKTRTTGEILNLASVDSSKFSDFAPFYAYIWAAPIQICVGFYLLYRLLGNATFVAAGVIIFMMLLQYYTSGIRSRFVNSEMKLKDQRIKLVNELLSSMKIIKLYAWEQAMESKINNERKKEINFIKKTFILDAFNWFAFSLSPNIVLIGTFAVYIFLIDNSGFSPAKAFAAISIFSILDFPISVLPTVISYLSQCAVSMARISSFLHEDELDDYVSKDYDEKLAVSIRNKAKFVWETTNQDATETENDVESNGTSSCESDTTKKLSDSDESKKKEKRFELKDIELAVEKNSFTVIIGKVGSGKSSLISAILGDMQLVENELGIKGIVNVSHEQDICYVAQQAWIQNASFKNNILFDKQLVQEQYKNVIKACALEPDLKQFENGDETEIGEKGINLSGGQKQRVSLARACYSSLSKGNKNQLILLDDPLSAVDAHVGKHLCEQVLNSKTGILKDTTRVLVTNQLNQLSDLDVDQIILLRDGKIELKCTYDDLLELEKTGQLGDYDLRLLQNKRSEEKATTKTETLEDKENEKDEKIKNERKKLIEKETVKEGRVNFENYKTYANFFGYNYCLIVLILLIVENSFQIYSRVYLANWTKEEVDSKDQTYINNYNRDHLLIFGGLAFSQCMFNLFANSVIILGVISTVTLFHKNLLYSILRSPMSFFDQTPVGRITVRFSSDINSVDRTLPIATREFLMNFFKLSSAVVILVVKQPNSFIYYVLIFIAYYLISSVYISASRQLKRYESTSKSPIFSTISESINGVSTIRAYKKTKHFERDCESKININTRAMWYYLQANRWLNFNLSLINCMIILVTSIQLFMQKEKTNGGDVGLLLTYAASINSFLTLTIRLVNMFEVSAVSIERIMEYCQNEEEDEWIKYSRPNENWPKEGTIEFENYSCRYREATNLVLKDLNFKIDSKDKCGIVGRTGAGKSTITLALFRIIEPAQGKILIDDVDINKIGLHDLRSKLSIIPQDPVLFTGTIRFNLDPFEKHSDKEIFESLEHAHLKDYVNSLEDGIQHKISEGGENLSVGQRQLICLARALLRKSKILVLDEATASVDFATDELVQKTIRSEFKDCTCITIAHRIQTILDSTKILVLEKGELEEYDTPEILLENHNSLFYALAVKANAV